MLNKIFSMSLLNLKQHYLEIGIGILLSLCYMAAWLSRSPKSFTVDYYQYELFKVNHIIMLFMACQMLVLDYVHGCVKVLYTGAMSRIEVLSSKFLGMIELSIILWIVSRVVYVISLFKLKMDINLGVLFNVAFASSLIVYMLAAMLISASIAVVVSLTQNQKATFVIGFLGLSAMQYFMPLFVYSNLFEKATGLKALLYYTPNYVLLEWTTNWKMTISGLVIFSVWIILVSLLAKWLTDKRSIRI